MSSSVLNSVQVGSTSRSQSSEALPPRAVGALVETNKQPGAGGAGTNYFYPPASDRAGQRSQFAQVQQQLRELNARPGDFEVHTRGGGVLRGEAAREWLMERARSYAAR